jgi:hypothetical protein
MTRKIRAAYAAWCRKQGSQLNCSPVLMTTGVVLVVVVLMYLTDRPLLMDILWTIAAITAGTLVVIIVAGGHRAGWWRWCRKVIGRGSSACPAGKQALRTSLHPAPAEGELIVGEYADGSPVTVRWPARALQAWAQRGDRQLHKDLLEGQVAALNAASESDPLDVPVLPMRSEAVHQPEPWFEVPCSRGCGGTTTSKTGGPETCGRCMAQAATGYPDQPEGEDGLPLSWPVCDFGSCPARWDGTCWHVPGDVPAVPGHDHLMPLPMPRRVPSDHDKWGSDEDLLRQAESIAARS